MIWDWWADIEKNRYYCLVIKNKTLYLSEAKIPENLENMKEEENG